MAEIKISDLSVGDWVRYDRGTTPYSIRSIYHGGGDNYCVVLNDSEFPEGVIAFACRLKPIPLTPEILEKNGFEEGLKNGEAYKIKVSFNQHLWLFKVEDDCWMFRLVFGLFEDFDIAKVEIKYVHQLQNALRLAGVGKEIEI